jgi:hypothetical protein
VSLAILLLAAAPAPAIEADNEILVLARKMQMIEVDIKAPRRHGVLTIERCRVTKGSGDAELDAIPCDVARQCMASAAPPTTRRALEACAEDQSQVRLDAIAAQRRAAPGDAL